MANIQKQADRESQRHQRLEEEVCRHEHAKSANGILTEEPSYGVVIWQGAAPHHQRVCLGAIPRREARLSPVSAARAMPPRFGIDARCSSDRPIPASRLPTAPLALDNRSVEGFFYNLNARVQLQASQRRSAGAARANRQIAWQLQRSLGGAQGLMCDPRSRQHFLTVIQFHAEQRPP